MDSVCVPPHVGASGEDRAADFTSECHDECRGVSDLSIRGRMTRPRVWDERKRPQASGIRCCDWLGLKSFPTYTARRCVRWFYF
jgi:hypothetical protein